MKLINKIKNKLFPDEKEILYYKNVENKEKDNDISGEIRGADSPINYRPTSFSSTQDISDTLKKGNVVVVDVSLLSKNDALRMIDFLGGVMYALNGDIKRLNKNVFEFSINDCV